MPIIYHVGWVKIHNTRVSVILTTYLVAVTCFVKIKVVVHIEHVLHHLAQITTYQVTDWSTGPRTSSFAHDILDTIFMTSLSDTN